MRTKHSGFPHWLGAKRAVPHSARWHKHSHALAKDKYQSPAAEAGHLKSYHLHKVNPREMMDPRSKRESPVLFRTG
jgi:hypothetical protein